MISAWWTHFKSLKTKYDQIIGNNRTSEKENVLEIICDSDDDICDIQEVKNTEKSVDIQRNALKSNELNLRKLETIFGKNFG